MSLTEWETQWRPSSNAPLGELIPGSVPVPGERRLSVSRERRRAAIADAMGQDVENIPEGLPEPSEHGLRDARSQTAAEFSEARRVRGHRADRRSQTHVGRHERYVRAQAAKAGIPKAEYDARMQLHPDGCPWQVTK